MTTSGTAAFNLDVAEIIEEAFERCGLESRSGYDVRTAIRSLNLLTIEWSNRGINLWTVDSGSIPIVPGTITYNLPADTVDLLDMVIREGTGVNQIDINISRISEPVYSYIPNKNSPGRPIQVWINRQAQAPQINIWPTGFPGINYTFVYWRLRRIQDSATAVNTEDIPFRFLNALVAGLSFFIAQKKPEVPSDRVQFLKAEYNEQMRMAMQEDREKADYRVSPRLMYYGR